VVLGVGHDSLKGTEGLAVDARNEEAAGPLDEAFANGGYLVRRLAEAEDDFREDVADAAMVVDLREAQVFVGQVFEVI